MMRRLDYSGCVPVDVGGVVGKAVSGGQLEFADGDSAAGLMLVLLRFWISQPAAVSRRSMLARARSSGLPVAGMVMCGSGNIPQHSAG